MYADTSAYERFDVGVPLARRLRILLVTELNYGGSETTPSRTLSLTPQVQYELRLPINVGHGELLVIAAGGIRRTDLWMKFPDQEFWPSTWESTTAYALRFTAGIEYRAHAGWIVSLQPLGIGVSTTPSPPDPRWMTTTPKYAHPIALLAGYQFR